MVFSFSEMCFLSNSSVLFYHYVSVQSVPCHHQETSYLNTFEKFMQVVREVLTQAQMHLSHYLAETPPSDFLHTAWNFLSG